MFWFFWQPEKTVDLSVSWDATMFIWRYCSKCWREVYVIPKINATSIRENPNHHITLLMQVGIINVSKCKCSSSVRPYKLSSVSGRCSYDLKLVTLKLTSRIAILSISCEFASGECHIGSGNGLVSLGNKPLPGPKLAQICFSQRRH